MFGIGMPEMILILAVALIVIGPKKLPDLAKSLGKAMGEFKKATSDLKESMQIDTELKEVKTAFNDLGREDKKETKGFTRDMEQQPIDTTGPIETPKAGKPEGPDGDAMDKLKEAFDRRDTDGSVSDTGSPAEGEASSSGTDPDAETRRG